MALWTRRPGRRIALLALMTTALMVSGVWVVYADSAEHAVPGAALADGQVSVPGAEAAMLGSTQGVTPTLTPTTRPPTPTAPPGTPVDVIFNGGFEQGFENGVGVGWGRFQNGNVVAGWYDDTWERVVYEGEHAQLVELTGAGEQDRYAGIFQTVNVVPNAAYVLTLHGLVRSVSGSVQESDFGFRMQYGIDYQGGTDWQNTAIQWIELQWDEQPRTDPTRFETYTATVTAKGNRLTLFIRAWKKWPDAMEGDYDIDAVSLVGPQAGGAQPTSTLRPTQTVQPTGSPQPTATTQPGMPVTGDAFSILANPAVVLPSIALLVVLIGGATWGLMRRRT